MKTAVTVTFCAQIGIDTLQDIRKTKVFDESATIAEILEWSKEYDKSATLSSLQISDFVE